MKAKSMYLLRLLVLFTLLAPVSASGQSASRLPSPGTHGVSFTIPNGGGAGFGVRKVLSGEKNAGLTFLVDLNRNTSDPENLPSVTRGQYNIGIAPDLRLYHPNGGPVVPYVLLSSSLTYGWISTDVAGADDTKDLAGGVSAGLGVEWFPLDGMSISGETGVTASGYRRTATSGSTDHGFSLRVFRSAMTLNLYF